MGDFDTFGSCFTGPGGVYGAGCLMGDFDDDGDIDCDDWEQFYWMAWTEPIDPPDFPGCNP